MPGYIFHHSCFFLVCFWNRNFIYYTSVSCVWFLLPYVNLQSNWAWKPLELGLSICSLVPKFHFQLTKEKLGPTYIVQFGKWRDSFSSALCSILSARSFNQWQYVLYPNFIIKTNNRKQDCSCAKKEGAFWNEQQTKPPQSMRKKIFYDHYNHKTGWKVKYDAWLSKISR